LKFTNTLKNNLLFFSGIIISISIPISLYFYDKRYLINFAKFDAYYVQKLLVKYNGNMIRYINDPTEEIQRLAVQQNGCAIQFIKNPTEKIQKLAVQRNGFAIEFINDPTEDVKKLAVQQDEFAIKYINAQFSKIYILVL
jgi:hypothetical protein